MFSFFLRNFSPTDRVEWFHKISLGLSRKIVLASRRLLDLRKTVFSTKNFEFGFSFWFFDEYLDHGPISIQRYTLMNSPLQEVCFRVIFFPRGGEKFVFVLVVPLLGSLLPVFLNIYVTPTFTFLPTSVFRLYIQWINCLSSHPLFLLFSKNLECINKWGQQFKLNLSCLGFKITVHSLNNFHMKKALRPS